MIIGFFGAGRQKPCAAKRQSETDQNVATIMAFWYDLDDTMTEIELATEFADANLTY